MVSSCHPVDWHHGSRCLSLLSLNRSSILSPPVARFFWLVSLPALFLAVSHPVFFSGHSFAPSTLWPSLSGHYLSYLFLPPFFSCSPFPPWQRKLDQSGPNEPLQAPKTPTLISLSDSGRVLKEPSVSPRRIQ